jgi:hypothetical protein
MSENTEIVEVILQKFTHELKHQAAVSYAGHKNLWVDLGWDLAQGDREVCQHVEDLLRLLIVNLPEDINEVIWSESWGGKAKLNDILLGINKKNADFNELSSSQADDILEDIVEYLKDRLFLAAEVAYSQFDEIDLAEEDYADEDALEDEEYDDEDDEGEE